MPEGKQSPGLNPEEGDGFFNNYFAGHRKKTQASIAGMVAQQSQGCPGILAAPDSSIHDSITPSTPPQRVPHHLGTAAPQLIFL